MAWTALGSMCVGILLNMWVYGIVCHMYITYWASVNKDVWWLRCLVPILCIIDTVQTAALGYQLYVICVEFPNLDLFSLFRVWPLIFIGVTQSLAGFIVTLVLIHRLCRLTHDNMYLAVTLSLLSLAVFIVGFTAAIKMWTFNYSHGFVGFDVVEKLFIVWHSVEAAMNTLISGGLVVVLSRSRTGFRRTDSVIDTLIRGSLQTGCYATIFSLLTVVFYTTQPIAQSIFVIFAMPLGRIYSATLMDTILARVLIRQNSSPHESNTYQMRGTVSMSPKTMELGLRKGAVYDARIPSVYDHDGKLMLDDGASEPDIDNDAVSGPLL